MHHHYKDAIYSKLVFIPKYPELTLNNIAPAISYEYEVKIYYYIKFSLSKFILKVLLRAN